MLNNATNHNKVLAIIIVLSLIIGIALGNSIRINNASAQNTSPTADTTPKDQSQGGHVGANGIKEELLTGDNAAKARDAALKAVPGGTVQRVETDAEGAVYEAHMIRTDRTPVTVKFDSNFNVTATENGFGKAQ